MSFERWITSTPAGSIPSSKRTLNLDIKAVQLDSAYEVPYSFQCSFNVLQRICERQTQIAFTIVAERRARQGRNARFIQQPVGKLVAGQPHAADVGKEVKSAKRFQTVNTLNVVQTVREHIPSLAKLGNHGS